MIQLNVLFHSKELLRLKGLFLFMLIIICFHLLYKYFEPDIIKIPFVIYILDWLTQILLNFTSLVLNSVFGIKSIISGDIIELPNECKIQMRPGCSGLQQFFLVVVIFILYPGPIKYKLWYIPLGILIIDILNILRFVFISTYSAWFPEHFHVVHDWIFRPFIYFVIFLLWVYWDSRIYRPIENKK